MNAQTLQKAIYDAERFLILAEAAREKTKHDFMAFYGSKETGAVRRASMDLTRALANLRRSH